MFSKSWAMRSNYKKLGQFIRVVDVRNNEGHKDNLLGVSTRKVFIDSVANTIGTDFKRYKIVKKHQFTYVPDTSRRGDKMGIAMLESLDQALVSQAYTVFEVSDKEQLNPEYLMMWFRRPEFDRYARFKSHGSVREIFDWEEMCDVELPVPSIEKQREIVHEYNVVNDRIALNEQIMAKLEKSSFALFDELFPVHGHEVGVVNNYLGELIEFNPTHSIKKDVMTAYVEMANLSESSMSIDTTIIRPFTAGSKFKNEDTLLARITPCLENGKTAYVECLDDGEVAFGSTEFIVMRGKNDVSPYWIYCLAKNENFRSYAISSMIGSSGRQRVHSDYLKEYRVETDSLDNMPKFHRSVTPIFKLIANKNIENQQLKALKELLLQRVA